MLAVAAMATGGRSSPAPRPSWLATRGPSRRRPATARPALPALGCWPPRRRATTCLRRRSRQRRAGPQRRRRATKRGGRRCRKRPRQRRGSTAVAPCGSPRLTGRARAEREGRGCRGWASKNPSGPTAATHARRGLRGRAPAAARSSPRSRRGEARPTTMSSHPYTSPRQYGGHLHSSACVPAHPLPSLPRLSLAFPVQFPRECPPQVVALGWPLGGHSHGLPRAAAPPRPSGGAPCAVHVLRCQPPQQLAGGGTGDRSSVHGPLPRRLRPGCSLGHNTGLDGSAVGDAVGIRGRGRGHRPGALCALVGVGVERGAWPHGAWSLAGAGGPARGLGDGPGGAGRGAVAERDGVSTAARKPGPCIRARAHLRGHARPRLHACPGPGIECPESEVPHFGRACHGDIPAPPPRPLLDRDVSHLPRQRAPGVPEDGQAQLRHSAGRLGPHRRRHPPALQPHHRGTAARRAPAGRGDPADGPGPSGARRYDVDRGAAVYGGARGPRPGGPREAHAHARAGPGRQQREPGHRAPLPPGPGRHYPLHGVGSAAQGLPHERPVVAGSRRAGLHAKVHRGHVQPGHWGHRQGQVGPMRADACLGEFPAVVRGRSDLPYPRTPLPAAAHSSCRRAGCKNVPTGQLCDTSPPPIALLSAA